MRCSGRSALLRCCCCLAWVALAVPAGAAAGRPPSPNTFIWSVPRSGSTLLLNSLGNSGFWNRSETVTRSVPLISGPVR